MQEQRHDSLASSFLDLGHSLRWWSLTEEHWGGGRACSACGEGVVLTVVLTVLRQEPSRVSDNSYEKPQKFGAQ